MRVLTLMAVFTIGLLGGLLMEVCHNSQILETKIEQIVESIQMQSQILIAIREAGLLDKE